MDITIKRMMAGSAKPEMTVTVDEPGKITVESRGLKSGTKTIVFDEEFEEKTGDGRNVLVCYFLILKHLIK